MSNSNQRKSGAILSYVSIILNTIIQLIYTPFLIKMLGQGEYGLYSLVSSIIGYLTVLDFGFGNAIIVFSTKYREQGKIKEEQKLLGMFKIVFYFIAIIAFVLGLILYLLVPIIFGNTMSTNELSKTKIMMLILAINLLITFSFSLYSSVISSHEKFVFQKLMAILNIILKPLIMIPLLFLGYKSISLTMVLTLVNVIICVSNYYFVRKKLKIKIKFEGFDKILFKTILSYSVWIFMGIIVDKLNWSIDQFVLGATTGTIAVSLYSVASSINTLFINLSTAISGVLLPKMSKLIANKVSGEELTSEFIKIGRLQYYLVFLMASGLTIYGKQFMVLWLGEEYVTSYYVTLLLVLPVCISLIQNLAISIRQAMNKHKFSYCVNFIVAIFNLIISIILAKRFGVLGSAFGTTLGLLISALINNIYYHKVLKLNMIKFWKVIIIMTLPFIIPIISGIVIMKFITINGWINFGINIIIYSLIYCIICYLFDFNAYEKNLITSIVRRK